MKRRELIRASLAAAPFALLVPSAATQEVGSKATRAIYTKARKDRFDDPYSLTVGHMDCKLSAKDTGGALSAFEALTNKPDRPVKHFHRDQEEWFYVLDGDYQFFVGDNEF